MDETLQNLHFCPMQLGSKIWFVPPMGTPALRVSGLGWKEPKPTGFVNRPNGTGDYLLMGFYGPAEFRDSTGMHRFEGPSVILMGAFGFSLLWKSGQHICSFLVACRWRYDG